MIVENKLFYNLFNLLIILFNAVVICKYFQQGTCRFGTKCANEHFDVRQLVKSDVEASINGKQWPFSCYGPFKDKPCIPNFIEDQSTEEVRFLCYEAKKSNMFDQFHQQFTKEAVECNNKMKALLQMSPEIFEIVSQIYNTPDAGAAVGNPNNPFKVNQPSGGGLFGNAATATNTTNNVFGGFGKTATQASNGAGNIFGNAAANNNAAASIFGGGNNQQQQNSIFGAPAAQAPATNSIFGGAPQQSMFGGQAQQQQANAGGIFGQAAQQTSGGGLFGKPAQPNAGGGAAGFGLFAQAAQQAPPAFGQAPSLFGGQQQQQQQQPATNVFGGQQPQQQANDGNLFRSQIQQQQQPAPGPFGQAQPAQGIFGQPQQAPQQQQPPATGFFGQPQQPPPAQQQQGGGLFGQQQQQQAPPAGFFANAASMAPQQQPGEGVFGQAASMQFKPPQSGAFILTTSTYTPLENLSQDDLKAFQAEQFEPGHIPFCPPPQQLV